MVACIQCQSVNSLDGVFCKKCGTALPEAELEAARTKLAELTKEGYNIFNENRIEEASMVAESALLSDPGSIQALTLKGMCLERLGSTAEALEYFERVVEL